MVLPYSQFRTCFLGNLRFRESVSTQILRTQHRIAQNCPKMTLSISVIPGIGGLIRKVKSKSSAKEPAPLPSPPPYKIESKSNPPPAKLQSIKASDTPQFLWMNAQCREWLFKVLIEYCGRSVKSANEAVEVVFGAGGFGPLMYFLSEDTWKEAVGWSDGASIYRLLLTVMDEEDAWSSKLEEPH